MSAALAFLPCKGLLEVALKIEKFGDGLVVHLPQEIVERLSLQDGDEVEITAADRHLEVSRDASREAALARIRAATWPLPPGYKFSRDEIYDHPRAVADDGN
jgi:antitoxin MazE